MCDGVPDVTAGDALAGHALIDDAVALVGPADTCGATRRFLGLAGAPASGKSTLAQALVSAVNLRLAADIAAYVPMDGFHLSNRQLARLGLRDRKGAPETFDVRGYVALLRRLAEERAHPVYVPGFDRSLDEPVAAALVVPPSVRLVVTEGNYLADDAEVWREVRGLLDELWYVETADAVREERLLTRHTAGGMTPDQARAFIARSEQRNAERVRRHRDNCTRVVEL